VVHLERADEGQRWMSTMQTRMQKPAIARTLQVLLLSPPSLATSVRGVVMMNCAGARARALLAPDA